jgi:hypothetical protein
MTQQEINQIEWAKPENWSGPKFLGLYSSQADARLWVPKRAQAWGWTINIGRRRGVALLLGILLAVAGVVVGASILGSLVVGLVVAALRHGM